MVVWGRDNLGGTCLNVGCIPSKALLHATHALHDAQMNFEKMGLMGAAPKVDWAKMQSYKDDVVGQNTKGIEFLLKKNKVTWIKGWAEVPAADKVKAGGTVYQAKHIVIATGSEPTSLPNVEIDEKIVMTSTGALALGGIPKKLVVIGAGVIGLEMGSIYARLGSEVVVVEYLDHITAGMDKDLAKTFQKILTKQGLKFVLGAAVQSVLVVKKRAEVIYKLNADGQVTVLDADAVLVATGRKPYVAGLGLEALGVALLPRGQVQTDVHFKTSVAGLYAIGDAIAGPMLAHKAEEEGMALAEILAGKAGHVNYDAIPSVVYSTPEVASVGKTEEQLNAEGRAYKVGRFSFMGNGRAKAVFQGEGFVKILADKSSDRILGAHIIGPMAGDLIHEICVAMEFGASAQDLALTCHAHPTYSEAVREAALACGDGAIHA